MGSLKGGRFFSIVFVLFFSIVLFFSFLVNGATCTSKGTCSQTGPNTFSCDDTDVVGGNPFPDDIPSGVTYDSTSEMTEIPEDSHFLVFFEGAGEDSGEILDATCSYDGNPSRDSAGYTDLELLIEAGLLQYQGVVAEMLDKNGDAKEDSDGNVKYKLFKDKSISECKRTVGPMYCTLDDTWKGLVKHKHVKTQDETIDTFFEECTTESVWQELGSFDDELSGVDTSEWGSDNWSDWYGVDDWSDDDYEAEVDDEDDDDWDETVIEGNPIFIFTNRPKPCKKSSNVGKVEINTYNYDYTCKYDLDSCSPQGNFVAYFYSGKYVNNYFTHYGEVTSNKSFCAGDAESCRSSAINEYYDWDQSPEACACGSNNLNNPFDWLDETVNVTDPLTTNLCCGNDPRTDVGMFELDASGNLGLCVQDPQNKFNWFFAGDAEDNDMIAGDVYTVFNDEVYPVYSDGLWKDFYEKDSVPIPEETRFDIVSDGNIWHVCSFEDNVKGKVDLTSADGFEIHDPADDDVVLIEEGTVHNYICTEEQGQPKFVECGRSAFNKNSETNTGSGALWMSKSSTVGEGTNSLYSFEAHVPEYVEPQIKSSTGNTNLVSFAGNHVIEGSRSLKLSLRNDDWYGGYVEEFKSLNLSNSNWQNKILTGYVYFDEYVPVSLKIFNGEDEKEFNLDRFFVGDVKLGEWNYFEIDTGESVVTNIGFVLSGEGYNAKTIGSYDVYFDDFSLESKSNYNYCGAQKTVFNNREKTEYAWFGSRDLNFRACEGTSLDIFRYGGSKCCGDDKMESFNDEFGTCFNSDFYDVNERFEVIEYGLRFEGGPRGGVEQKVICNDEKECKYFLPEIQSSAIEGIYLINEHPEKYKLVFESNGLNYTTESNDKVVVSEIYNYEFLVQENEVRYCGLNVGDIDDSTLRGLVRSDFTIDNGCNILGGFRCSLSQGWTADVSVAEQRDLENASGPSDYGVGGLPEIAEFNTLKEVPSEFKEDYAYSKSCCPEDYCWDGLKCVENMENNPTRDFSFLIDGDRNHGYRCINGDWVSSIKKLAPSGEDYGFCPEDDQCFVSANGNFLNNGNLQGNPQCVNSNQYLGTVFCQGGNWVSRTKFVAKYLLDKSKSRNDISIYCDSFEQAVNYYSSSVNGVNLHDVINNPELCKTNASEFGYQNCMNNFCVLKSKEGIAFGTSVNLKLVDGNVNLQDLFNIENTRNCENKGELAMCDSKKVDGRQIYWYYDSSKGILINSEFRLNRGGNIFSRIFNAIKDWLSGNKKDNFDFNFEEIQTELNLDYLTENQNYDTMYYSNAKNGVISAIYGNIFDVEKSKSGAYVGIKYESFNFDKDDMDICEYVKHYKEYEKPFYRIVCTDNNGGSGPVYVFAISDDKDSTPITIWNDLTSKLKSEE